MDTDGPPGAPAHWSLNRTLAAVGVAAVIAAVGGTALYAATADSAGPGHAMHMPPAGMPGIGGVGAPPPVPALHGETVVADGDGGFTRCTAR